MTSKIPGARTVASPHFVRRYRRMIGRSVLLFGRLPRGLTRATVEDRTAGVRGEWVMLNADPNAATVVYYLHGGGYVAGSPAMYRTLTGAFCRRCRVRVFALDYRLAPEHRFPAAVHDAVAGYRWLLDAGNKPRDIVIAGDSAGGGLALSTMLALRDAGLPLPAGAVMIAPWVDLAATVVVSKRGERRIAHAYVGDRPLDDPLASGLYAELHGLPPLMIQASTIEMLRDDAVRLDAKARSAGVESTLRLWDGVPHVWHIFSGLPESREAFAEIAGFVTHVTGR
ncbi:MAG: alpha/beta hydrolase [Candidatus Eremiobacteraeota bacterium]|nr:alpha/beta hydrolase [Candidatus Eremiobacteraeota bacterium]